MILLSSADLAYMRGAQAQALPSVCDVRRQSSSSSDGAGGNTFTWMNVYAGIPCRIASENVAERQADGSVRVLRQTVLTLEHDKTVQQRDRVLCNGVTYEVSGVTEHSWRTARRVTLTAIT